MPSVAWAYDGAPSGSGVLTATITGAIVGRIYKLGTWSFDFQHVTVTATSSTVVLTATGITGDGTGGGTFIIWVGDDNGNGSFPSSRPEASYLIDTTLITVGVAGETPSDPSTTISYNGNKTFTLTTTHVGGVYLQLQYIDVDNGSQEDDNTFTGPGTFTLDITGLPIGNIGIDVELDPDFYDAYAHGIFPYTGPFPTFLEAEDDYNSDPLYAAIVTISGKTYVKVGTSPEVYNDDDTDFDTIVDEGNCHPTFFIRNDRLPAAGRYSISLKFRGGTKGTSFGANGWIVVRRNGLSLTPILFYNHTDSPDFWVKLNSEDYNQVPGPTSFPFLPGDVYEFCLFDQEAGSNSIAVDQIRLDLLEAGGSPRSIPMLAPPEYAVGSTWTDVDAMTDPTMAPILLDMCITNDGTIYAIWLQGLATGSSASNRIFVRSFNGTSWTTLSSDLAGHGTTIRDTWVSCASDGTNVYFLFGDEDGTNVSGIGHVSGNNRVWRVMKWNGSSFTELGTGQRQIGVRTVAFADLATEGLPCTIAVSPAGVPWVFWTESPNAVSAENDLPHAWYWSGSAWVDTSLTPHHHVHGFYTAAVVSNCNEFGVVFADANGTPSENPCMIFGYQDGTGSDPAYIAFQFQKWNGSAWTNILDFISTSVWPNLLGPPTYTQHFHQGIHLFVWQGKIWVSLAPVFHFGDAAQGSMAFLESDMSAFTAPDKPYWDRASWNSDTSGSFSETEGWAGDGTTTGRPVIDDDGNLWFLMGTFFTGYDTNGPTVNGRQENGTQDAMTMGWRDPIDTTNGGPNGGVYGEFQFSDAGFVQHNNTLYILVYASLGSDDALLLYKCERDDDYAAWTAGQASIFWFYKEGQWRNQGVDTEYAIHFREGGSWKKDTSLKGQLEGTWQS